MAHISIRDFSCIHAADMEIKEVNVIIGPQGAGKSVTTKLIYYFNDIWKEFFACSEEGQSFIEFKKALLKKFNNWFPREAWGPSRFKITFTNGPIVIDFWRRMSRKGANPDPRLTISAWLEEVYGFALKTYQEALNSNETDPAHAMLASRSFDWEMRIRSIITDRLNKDLQEKYFDQQTFIPAGRAFFTSIGRLVAGIEHGNSLDPVTLKFARIFASWRDQSFRYIMSGTELNEYSIVCENIMNSLFGGRVHSKRDAEYIEMPDGRKVPFWSLSSGQQELIPIWFFLANTLFIDAMSNKYRREREPSRHLVYIEEPEAHLFPSAQSALLESLIANVVGEKTNRNLIITTHSPYIISQLNIFLKAGNLARRKKRNQDIHAVVNRKCWLRTDSLSAWSLEDGVLKSLIDPEEQLIDAHYLDAVSDTISETFNMLLDIESSL